MVFCLVRTVSALSKQYETKNTVCTYTYTRTNMRYVSYLGISEDIRNVLSICNRKSAARRISNTNVVRNHLIHRGDSEDPQDTSSSEVTFCKAVIWLVALLRGKTCNLKHQGRFHSVVPTEGTRILQSGTLQHTCPCNKRALWVSLLPNRPDVHCNTVTLNTLQHTEALNFLPKLNPDRDKLREYTSSYDFTFVQLRQQQYYCDPLRVHLHVFEMAG